MKTFRSLFRLGIFVTVTAVSSLAALICAQPTPEKQLAPLPIEEALHQRNFLGMTPISLSRDGRMVAYTLQDSRRREAQANSTNGRYSDSGVLLGLLSSDIWISDTAGGEAKNLTNGSGTSWGPSWSPDGERLAFYSDRSGEQRVWLWERNSGTLRQLADAPARSLLSDPIQWTANGAQILVRLLPEGMTIKQANDLFLTPIQQNDEKTTTGDSGVTVYSSAAPTNKKGQPRSQGSLQAFNNGALADIALIDITNGRVTRLTRNSHPIWFALSPDGSSLAFTEMKGLESEREIQSLFDIVVVTLGPKSTTRVLATNVRQQSGRTVSWSPDSKMLGYITGGPLAKGDCFVIAVADGSTRNVTPNPHPDFDIDFFGPRWDGSGRNLYLINRSSRDSDSLWRVDITEGKAMPLARIDGLRIIDVITPSGTARVWSPDSGRSLVVVTRDDAMKQEGLYRIEVTTGTAVKLREGPVSFGPLPSFKIDVSADGSRVIYALQSAGQSEDLWLTDRNALSEARRVTRANPQLDKYVMGESRVIEWLSSEGQLLRGSLLLPAGYKAGTRCPMVVVQYPGAMLSNNANRYPQYGTLNTQLLATRGYAVLLPDLPNKRGTIMSDLPKAVLPGINKVVEMGIADSDRIGVWGHSLGGYGVLSLIVQTTRFKAAVDSAGLSNIISSYGQMGDNGSSIYIGHSEQFVTSGTLWTHRGSFIENSPVFYLDKVETPLLILQGTEDDATAPFHSDQVFVFLRTLGKEVEYAKYKGEPHAPSLWSYRNRIDFLNRTITWFDRWLKAPAGVPKPAEKPSALTTP